MLICQAVFAISVFTHSSRQEVVLDARNGCLEALQIWPRTNLIIQELISQLVDQPTHRLGKNVVLHIL